MSTWRERLQQLQSTNECGQPTQGQHQRGHNDSGAGGEGHPGQSSDLERSDANRESGSFIGSYSEFAGLAIGFASVIGEIVLSHPCIVLRHQCQIRHDTKSYHLTPFTLIPVVWRIARNQGLGSLWRGMGSVFIVRGIGLLSETLISELTPFPKEVTRHSSMKKMGQHLILKSLSWVLIAPFYAASLVEVVQTDVGMEPPGLLTCIREGISRVFRWGRPGTRILPFWQFMPPVVLLGVGHYVLRSVVSIAVQQYLRGEDADDTLLPTSASSENLAEDDPRHLAITEAVYEQYYTDLTASVWSSLVADVVCFPLETLVHRLCIQGTRIMIDDTDTGAAVAPVVAAYDGFFDALRTISGHGGEGGSGFFKGFGALVLQYSLQLLLLYAVRMGYESLLIFWNGGSSEGGAGMGELSGRRGPRSRVSRRLGSTRSGRR